MCSPHHGGRKTRAVILEVPFASVNTFACSPQLGAGARWELAACDWCFSFGLTFGVLAWGASCQAVRDARADVRCAGSRTLWVRCGRPSPVPIAFVGDGRAARRAERRRLGERGPAHPIGMRA